MHRRARRAEACGVKSALENVDRFEPLGNPTDLPRLVRMVDSPAVGYCLDSGHAHCCGNDIVKWIDAMGDRIFTTHFHDNHGPQGKVFPESGYITPSGIDEHLPPGFGTISWTDVILALWRIGYARPITFESGPWPGMDAAEGWKAAIRYWRTCEHLAAKKNNKGEKR